jgi:hypothetical protein
MNRHVELARQRQESPRTITGETVHFTTGTPLQRHDHRIVDVTPAYSLRIKPDRRVADEPTYLGPERRRRS